MKKTISIIGTAGHMVLVSLVLSRTRFATRAAEHNAPNIEPAASYTAMNQ